MHRIQSEVAIVPSARIDGLVTTETADELLVYDMESHHIHHLNRTSTVVWTLCDGRRSVSEIARLATAELGNEIGEDVVRLALGKLDDANLLAGSLDAGVRGAAQSRRAFLRKAAVAGAAVPAIVSITAPSAAAQDSCENIECGPDFIGVCCYVDFLEGITGTCQQAEGGFVTCQL